MHMQQKQIQRTECEQKLALRQGVQLTTLIAWSPADHAVHACKHYYKWSPADHAVHASTITNGVYSFSKQALEK